jgi:hypothetical protein
MTNIERFARYCEARGYKLVGEVFETETLGVTGTIKEQVSLKHFTQITIQPYTGYTVARLSLGDFDNELITEGLMPPSEPTRIKDLKVGDQVILEIHGDCYLTEIHSESKEMFKVENPYKKGALMMYRKQRSGWRDEGQSWGKSSAGRLYLVNPTLLARVEKTKLDLVRREAEEAAHKKAKLEEKLKREAFLNSPEGKALTAARDWYEGCEQVERVDSGYRNRRIIIELVYKNEVMYRTTVTQHAEWDEESDYKYFMAAPTIDSHSGSGDYRKFSNMRPALDRAMEIAKLWDADTGREVSKEFNTSTFVDPEERDHLIVNAS